MSTHLLGDVQLVTAQEVEAMLDAVVVPESVIDRKVDAVKNSTETRLESVAASVQEEAAAREKADRILDDKISDEAKLRDDAFDTVQKHLDDEESARKQADDALLKNHLELAEKFRDIAKVETEELSNLKCLRFKNLPIATVQVDNDDKSLKVGDTIASVTDKYRPAIPVDFCMTAEQVKDGVSSAWLVLLRLDAAGNVNVVNMLEAAGGSSATDTATVTYITRS